MPPWLGNESRPYCGDSPARLAPHISELLPAGRLGRNPSASSPSLLLVNIRLHLQLCRPKLDAVSPTQEARRNLRQSLLAAVEMTVAFASSFSSSFSSSRPLRRTLFGWAWCGQVSGERLRRGASWSRPASKRGATPWDRRWQWTQCFDSRPPKTPGCGTRVSQPVFLRRAHGKWLTLSGS